MNLEQEKNTLSTDCMSAYIHHAQSGMKKCYTTVFLLKGQIKPKADWCAMDSPKKRICFFAMTVRKYLKLDFKFQVFPNCDLLANS